MAAVTDHGTKEGRRGHVLLKREGRGRCGTGMQTLVIVLMCI